MSAFRIRSTLKSVLIGIGISVPITVLGFLMSLPAVVYLMPYLDFFLAPIIIPILCNVFVWWFYMRQSRRATQYSLIITGVVLSLVLGFIFILALYFSMINDF